MSRILGGWTRYPCKPQTAHGKSEGIETFVFLMMSFFAFSASIGSTNCDQVDTLGLQCKPPQLHMQIGSISMPTLGSQ